MFSSIFKVATIFHGLRNQEGGKTQKKLRKCINFRQGRFFSFL